MLHRYSRRIVWLELLTTNNDPGVVVLPYLLALLDCEGKHLPSYIYAHVNTHVMVSTAFLEDKIHCVHKYAKTYSEKFKACGVCVCVCMCV